MAFYVYILQCVDGSFYTGYTKNLDERIRLHQNGKGARYTKSHRPELIAYVEVLESRSAAMERERRLKKLSHKQKLELASRDQKGLSGKVLNGNSKMDLCNVIVAKRTWQEKLYDNKNGPRVQVINEKLSKRWGVGTMVIATPLEVDRLMRQVPSGRLTTINEIRAALAKKHGATIGCPLTTGIFAWIAANAAEEQKQQGETDITPYWRTLKTKGMLNSKYPGGKANQMSLLKQEGHIVIEKGKFSYVKNYEEALFRLS